MSKVVNEGEEFMAAAVLYILSVTSVSAELSSALLYYLFSVKLQVVTVVNALAVASVFVIIIL